MSAPEWMFIPMLIVGTIVIIIGGMVAALIGIALMTEGHEWGGLLVSGAVLWVFGGFFGFAQLDSRIHWV